MKLLKVIMLLAALCTASSPSLAHRYKVKDVPQDSKPHELFHNDFTGEVNIHICAVPVGNNIIEVRLDFEPARSGFNLVRLNDSNNPDIRCVEYSLKTGEKISAFTTHGVPNNSSGTAAIRYIVTLD